MTVLFSLASRILVLTLAATAAVGQLAYLDALYWHRLGWADPMPGTIQASAVTLLGADAVVAVLAAVVALSLAFHRGPRRGGRELAVAVAAWAYLLSYGGILRLLDPSPSSPLRAAVEGHFLVVECLGLAGLVAFSTAFPAPLQEEDLGDAARLPVGLRTLHGLRVWLLRPSAPWVAALGLTAVTFGLASLLDTPLVEAPLNPVMDLARFGTLAAVVVNMRTSWRMQNAEGRSRITWVAGGLAILLGALAVVVGGNVLFSVTEWRLALNWPPLVMNLGLLGILWGGAMAVFYEGRMRAEALVRGTARWAGLITLLLLLCTCLEALFSDALMSRVDLPTGIGTLVGVCIFAWIFEPTNRLLTLAAERLWPAVHPGDAPA